MAEAGKRAINEGFPRLRSVLWFSPASATIGAVGTLMPVIAAGWVAFQAMRDFGASDLLVWAGFVPSACLALFFGYLSLGFMRRLLTNRCAMRLTNSGVEFHNALSRPARIPYRAIEQVEIIRCESRSGSNTPIKFTRLVLHLRDRQRPVQVDTRLIDGGVFSVARFAAALRKQLEAKALEMDARAA